MTRQRSWTFARRRRGLSVLLLCLVFAALLLTVSDNGQLWLDACHYASAVSDDLSCETPRTRAAAGLAIEGPPAAALLAVAPQAAAPVETSWSPPTPTVLPSLVFTAAVTPIRGPPRTSA